MLPEQFRLVGGTIVKKCPTTTKPLYCSKDGRFFSVHNMQITDEGCIMRELKPHFNPAKQISRPNMHSAYSEMRQFGGRLCHHLIYETWKGPRTPGMEIDHINGDKMNWSLDNLEEVTPAENRKRAKLLRELRRNGRDPKRMTRDELQSIFRKYTIVSPSAIMDADFTNHREF